MEWISISSPEEGREELERAARYILRGGLLVYPTETFYGLGALALDEGAVKKVFQQKRRPPEKQLTVLISDLDSLREFVVDVPYPARVLAERFWPGPLTIILEAKPHLLKSLQAVTAKVGFRISSHPVALELTKLVGAPITATSANVSGNPPVADPKELPRVFLDGIDMVIDAGKTPGGAPSTIVDVTGSEPVILRAGPLAKDLSGIIKTFS